MPEGTEYELARRFAEELGVKLKITPMRSYVEIYAALNSGRAHMAAAGLKVPVQPIAGIEFGPAYQRVREHLIYRRGATRPGSLAEIGNGDLEIAAGSSHAKALTRPAIPCRGWCGWKTPPPNSQALLEGVADGTIDYTIADSTEFALAHDAHPDLRIAFDFPGGQSLAWAASTRYPEFPARHERLFRPVLAATGELAAIVKRYYGRSEDAGVRGAPGFMRHLQSRLPLYKKWFEEAAEQSSQDWRLLAAIGYQESKWNPSAASASGAKGLMQLTLESASAVKVANPSDPRQSIFGGARYFRQVYEKIPSMCRSPIEPGLRLPPTTSDMDIWKMRAFLRRKRAAIRIPGRTCANFYRCSNRSIGIHRRRTATRAAGSPCAMWTTFEATGIYSNGWGRQRRRGAVALN